MAATIIKIPRVIFFNALYIGNLNINTIGACRNSFVIDLDNPVPMLRPKQKNLTRLVP